MDEHEGKLEGGWERREKIWEGDREVGAESLQEAVNLDQRKLNGSNG